MNTVLKNNVRIISNNVAVVTINYYVIGGRDARLLIPKTTGSNRNFCFIQAFDTTL